MKHVRLIQSCALAVCTSFVLIQLLSTILRQGPQHITNITNRRSMVVNISRKKESGVNATFNNFNESIPTLLWWDSVYDTVDDVRTCGGLKCHVTNNRNLKQNPGTKAFLFYGSQFKPYSLPLPRHPDDTWAIIQEESPRNAYLLCHNDAINMFNITSSWNRKSHYPVTTQWLKCSDWLWDTEFLASLEDKNRFRKQGMAPILYLHSDCGVPSDRDHFVTILQKYIRVDSYGTCVKNKRLPERLRFRNSMAPMEDTAFFRWAARYKFTLAMENYVCEDYTTEKLWRPLRLGSVPVVFGAPNVKEFLPENNNSAILVNDFADIEQLAEYIHKVDNDDELYNSYLEFKTKPLENKVLQEQLDKRDWNPSNCKKKRKRTNHLKYIFKVPEERTYPYQTIFEGFECYLCKLLHSIQNERRLGLKPKTYLADSSQYHCPKPKMFNEMGQYNVDNDQWTAEWHYGKYEAEVMKELVRDNIVISEKEYKRIVKEAWLRDKDR